MPVMYIIAGPNGAGRLLRQKPCCRNFLALHNLSMQTKLQEAYHRLHRKPLRLKQDG
jgi:hypothetical protein